jgi:hypothetical protein
MVSVQTRNAEVMKSAVLTSYKHEIGAADLISSYMHYPAMSRYQLNEILYEIFHHLKGTCILNTYNVCRKLKGKKRGLKFLLHLADKLAELYSKP